MPVFNNHTPFHQALRSSLKQAGFLDAPLFVEALDARAQRNQIASTITVPVMEKWMVLGAYPSLEQFDEIQQFLAECGIDETQRTDLQTRYEEKPSQATQTFAIRSKIEPKVLTVRQQAKCAFGAALKDCRREMGLDQATMCASLKATAGVEISKVALLKWEHGTNLPDVAHFKYGFTPITAYAAISTQLGKPMDEATIDNLESLFERAFEAGRHDAAPRGRKSGDGWQQRFAQEKLTASSPDKGTSPG